MGVRSCCRLPGGSEVAWKNILVYPMLFKLEHALSRGLVQMQILFGEVCVGVCNCQCLSNQLPGPQPLLVHKPHFVCGGFLAAPEVPRGSEPGFRSRNLFFTLIWLLLEFPFLVFPGIAFQITRIHLKPFSGLASQRKTRSIPPLHLSCG